MTTRNNPAPQTKQAPPHKQNFFSIILFTVMLAAVGQMTNTIYAPAMSLMSHGLHISVNYIQAVMACYLLTYGASQFLHGPLSDRFGRRPIILVGLIIFIIGSVIATTASNFSSLLIGSLIQGTGIGCGGVMIRTVLRDLYSGKPLHKAASITSVVSIAAPLAAPLLGGLFSHYWGWRANFTFLSSFGLIVFLLHWWRFPETNRFINQHPFSIKATGKRYWQILQNRHFLAYTACLIVTFAGVSIFEAVGGILFGHVLKYNPIDTSLWFTIPLVPYMLGNYYSGYLVKHLSLHKILQRGFYLLLAGALAMLATGLLGWLNPWAIELPIMLYLFAAGLLYPAATSGALEPFPEQAGSAGALVGGLQNIGACLGIFISSLFAQHSQLPLGILLTVMSALVGVIFLAFL